MANIKISELNELLPGQKAYDDYLAIVDSSADETKKISVETLTSTGIKLIAVSSTAPTEFSNGDKYYNSTTNRIYEARTDVWYNPQEPVEGIFYIIFDSQNIYTYDKENETLVSVGGGAGGGGETLPVGSEINFDGQASDIPVGWEEVDNVLWTNSNPSSDFSNQDISINNINDFNCFKIVIRNSKTSSVVYTVDYYKTAYTTITAILNDGSNTYFRNFTFDFTNNKIVASQSSIPGVGYHNETNIPLYVIGMNI